MEGIHIFNQTEIVTINSDLIIASFLLGILFIVMRLEAIGELNKASILGIILFIVGVLFVSIALSKLQGTPSGKFTYTVTIDKNVNLIEFNEKYNILSQDGELYIIRDKEVE